ALETGHIAEYEALWRTDDPDLILERVLPESARTWLTSIPESERWDAILLDEGQDFLFLWWTALRDALKSGGEALLCADRVQNIYGVKPWTEDEMRGAGFRGPWVTLPDSFRLSPSLCRLTARFVDEFLPDS